MRLQYSASIRRLMPPTQGHSSSPHGTERWLAFWQTAGAALLGIVLARWVWLLLSPAGAALPVANGNDFGEVSQLFGVTNTHDAQALSPASNIQLVGVFARKTNGFAILQVDGKQIGIAQGEEVRPGLRLAETHATYVLLEQGGETLRVDLQGATMPAGTSAASPTGTAPGTAPLPAHGSGPSTAPRPSAQGRIDALQQRLDATPNISPKQRQMLEREIENMRMHSR